MFFLVLGFLVSPSRPTTQSSPAHAGAPAPQGSSTGRSQPYEVMLATIEKQSPVAASDPLVAAFKVQLDLLEPRCVETRGQLSDLAVSTRDIMAKRGVEESLLSILKGVASSLPASGSRMKCTDVFAAYATLRIQR